jgi:hypothetical protein
MKSGTHDLSVQDIYNQMIIKHKEFNALEERVGSVESFSDRTLPIMMNLTISDYF